MHRPRDLTVDGRARPGSGVGRFCCELIKLGIREEKIAELARERFGGKTLGRLRPLVRKQDAAGEASRLIRCSSPRALLLRAPRPALPPERPARIPTIACGMTRMLARVG
jgi:hypothetical protein